MKAVPSLVGRASCSIRASGQKRSRTYRGVRSAPAGAAQGAAEFADNGGDDGSDWPDHGDIGETTEGQLQPRTAPRIPAWGRAGCVPSTSEDNCQTQSHVPPAAEGGSRQDGAAGSRPFAASEAAARQQKWDAVRPATQRCYVENLARATALRRRKVEAHKALLVEWMATDLVTHPPQCDCCGGSEMRLGQPAEVLYIATDVCFPLEVPRYYCQKVGCSGGYAPKSFVVDCFPATPLASWDVTKASAGQPARWIAIQLLQFFDGLVFGTRQAAWQSLAKVLHEQWDENGCGGLLTWQHFRRQLGESLMVRLARCYAPGRLGMARGGRLGMARARASTVVWQHACAYSHRRAALPACQPSARCCPVCRSMAT